MPRRAIPLLIGLALAGCAHEPQKPVVPATITVTVTKYVPINDALTEPCEKTLPNNRAVMEAFRVAQARGLELDRCSDRMQKIREISHKGATPDQPLE